MKKIVITGANGTIGRVLQKGLKGYSIVPLDIPGFDVKDYGKLLGVFAGQELVVHLAWDTKVENSESGIINADNALMTFNVYRAATASGVRRVIMASSVHADEFLDWKGPKLLETNKIPIPTSPYGASKVFMEALGRYYAKHLNLEVICIRFGGVNSKNKITKEILEAEPIFSKVWFSHKDCVALVKACIEAEYVPDNFVVIYGVSNNSQRIHDVTNPFGWVPVGM